MPIYMDLHLLPGINAENAADAHFLDVKSQHEHGCKCFTYWVDKEQGQVFCLIEAPSKENVAELHRNAHGFVPHKIIEVAPDFVRSFLGRITDPEHAQKNDKGLLLIDDPAFRSILMVSLPDPVLQQQQYGSTQAQQYITQQNRFIREQITKHNGKEVAYTGNSILGSFISSSNALAAAKEILAYSKENDQVYSINIHAGSPVDAMDTLFGETLQLLERMSAWLKPVGIAVTPAVKKILSKELLHKADPDILALNQKDEDLLTNWANALERYHATEHQVTDYARLVNMSTSQLYRNTMRLTGLSPNELLQKYRLQKATQLMKEKKLSIAEIAFSCGFSSPSYFTKCFRKAFGVLPLAYMERL
jgi:AraC-like DNA-binding protein